MLWNETTWTLELRFYLVWTCQFYLGRYIDPNHINICTRSEHDICSFWVPINLQLEQIQRKWPSINTNFTLNHQLQKIVNLSVIKSTLQIMRVIGTKKNCRAIYFIHLLQQQDWHFPMQRKLHQVSPLSSPCQQMTSLSSRPKSRKIEKSQIFKRTARTEFNNKQMTY